MAQLPSSKCNYCESKIGNTYCYQCRYFLCDPCRLGHDKFPATKKHCVTDAKNIDRFTLTLNVDCDKHNMEFVHYCRTCDCLICTTCVTSDHKDHAFSGIREKSLEIRKRVDENIASLELRERSLLDFISRTQLLIDQVRNERDCYLEDIAKTSEDIIGIVESVTTDKHDHVCKLYSEEIEAIESVMSHLLRAKEERTLLCTKLKDMRFKEYDLEFLFHHKQLTNDLEHPDDNIPGLYSRHKIHNLNNDLADLVVQKVEKKYNLSNGHPFVEEIKCLQRDNQQLKEKTNDMTENLACLQRENTFMKDMMTSVIQCIKKTDEIKNQSEYLSKLPREQNPVKDKFLDQTEYVLNHVIKITNDLRKTEQQLKDQCLIVAEWTNDQSRMWCDTLDSDRELKSKLSSCKQEIICYQNKMKDIQTAYDDLSLQNARLHQQVFEKGMDVQLLTKLKRSLKEKDDAIEILRKEKDDLQNRFSSIAGEKLREGNPAIAALGDPNRPMKIGEKYGHIYDNEWTDAMACISTVSSLFPKLQETEIEVVVRHLCYILRCCYKECFIMAQEQLQSIAHTMQLDVDEVLVTKISSKDWDYSKKNDDLIRQLTETDFFQECVHLCWTMVIQDPAIHLDENLPLGTVYNKTHYKEFTESGDKVKYVVWPALFLHKYGPLLFKGVVEAYK